ncbi:LCP family protein [Clostridium algidicarnis]|uniref:LCP family protein n=1 Tax=Clostridium algidicarnis TaxID=37659 RepID=UPI001C0DAB17|nr:LCP family protein [Clostridium algidicarnis]MBU3209275.1 LCP family protein [Clostridium algidicarnis]
MDRINKKIRSSSSSNPSLRKKKKKVIRRKKKSKVRKRKIIAYSLIFILFSIMSISVLYALNLLGKIKTTVISKDTSDLGIDNSISPSFNNNDIINIALFGLDQHDPNEPSRSDATMIITIDKKADKIKMSSIMRDSYVNIDGHGKDKLNHAYAFGGPELALKTVNKNYKLNIKDFVSINFSNMEKLIDTLGGVEIDVKQAEIEKINYYVRELNSSRNSLPTYMTRPGKQKLNGMQALGYTRIRDVGNGDFERTDRQRIVLNQLFDNIKETGITKYPSIVSSLLPLVETSLSKTDIIKLGTDVLSNGKMSIEQERFPLDGYYKDGGEVINNVWYLPFDEDSTIKQINEYIFKDKKPEPKKG